MQQQHLLERQPGTAQPTCARYGLRNTCWTCSRPSHAKPKKDFSNLFHTFRATFPLQVRNLYNCITCSCWARLCSPLFQHSLDCLSRSKALDIPRPFPQPDNRPPVFAENQDVLFGCLQMLHWTWGKFCPWAAYLKTKQFTEFIRSKTFAQSYFFGTNDNKTKEGFSWCTCQAFSINLHNCPTITVQQSGSGNIGWFDLATLPRIGKCNRIAALTPQSCQRFGLIHPRTCSVPSTKKVKDSNWNLLVPLCFIDLMTLPWQIQLGATLLLPAVLLQSPAHLQQRGGNNYIKCKLR